MKSLTVSIVTLAFCTSSALAQAEPDPAAPAAETTATPPAAEVPNTPAPATTTEQAPAKKKPSYEEYRREELKVGIKRTRNALIATGASFAVGLALVIPAFTSDNCVTFNNNYDLDCTRKGKALLGVGYPLLWGGAIGALVSGIMFGVRRGKVRRLNQKIYMESEAKVRWDIATSRFVF